MLIYLLIAAEIGILYTIFWYVFIREPKPFSLKFKRSVWGKYADQSLTAGGIEPPKFARPNLSSLTAGPSPTCNWESASKRAHPAGKPARGHERRRAAALRARRRRQLFISLYPERELPNDLLTKVLTLVSKTLDELHVKLP